MFNLAVFPTQPNVILSPRLQSTAPQPEVSNATGKTRKASKKFQPNKSFVMNVFRGVSVTEQAIPYPYYLTEEQKETLEMLVDPTVKFMEVSDGCCFVSLL